mgnify:CR=1 FL=1
MTWLQFFPSFIFQNIFFWSHANNKLYGFIETQLYNASNQQEETVLSIYNALKYQ